MHKVLIPIDGSPTALRAVGCFAAAAPHLQQTEVLLLNVQQPADGAAAAQQQAGEKLLAPAQAALERAGIAHAAHVEFGDPAATIAEFAEKHGCKQIIMGTHGLGALASLVMGSVAAKVLHHASVPVMLVK